MDEIRFYIPEGETIPTKLALYVGDVYVTYGRRGEGFIFNIRLDDEQEALEAAGKIIARMISEQGDPAHGVSWRTVAIRVIQQDERYKTGTMVEWLYRVRDSY